MLPSTSMSPSCLLRRLLAVSFAFGCATRDSTANDTSGTKDSGSAGSGGDSGTAGAGTAGAGAGGAGGVPTGASGGPGGDPALTPLCAGYPTGSGGGGGVACAVRCYAPGDECYSIPDPFGGVSKQSCTADGGPEPSTSCGDGGADGGACVGLVIAPPLPCLPAADPLTIPSLFPFSPTSLPGTTPFSVLTGPVLGTAPTGAAECCYGYSYVSTGRPLPGGARASVTRRGDWA